MADLKLETNAADVANFLNDYAHKAVAQASVSATNKTMAQVQTRVKGEVSAETGVPKGVLGSRMRLYRANVRKVVARIFVGTISIAAIRLGAKQLGRGVSFRGAAGRVKAQGAFIQTLPRTGREAVLVRRGRERLPIDEVRVPIAGAVQRAATSAMGFAKATYDVIFARDVEFHAARAKQKHRV